MKFVGEREGEFCQVRERCHRTHIVAKDKLALMCMYTCMFHTSIDVHSQTHTHIYNYLHIHTYAQIHVYVYVYFFPHLCCVHASLVSESLTELTSQFAHELVGTIAQATSQD